MEGNCQKGGTVHRNSAFDNDPDEWVHTFPLEILRGHSGHGSHQIGGLHCQAVPLLELCLSTFALWIVASKTTRIFPYRTGWLCKVTVMVLPLHC